MGRGTKKDELQASGRADPPKNPSTQVPVGSYSFVTNTPLSSDIVNAAARRASDAGEPACMLRPRHKIVIYAETRLRRLSRAQRSQLGKCFWSQMFDQADRPPGAGLFICDARAELQNCHNTRACIPFRRRQTTGARAAAEGLGRCVFLQALPIQRGAIPIWHGNALRADLLGELGWAGSGFSAAISTA